MKINFTKKEYRDLIDILELAEWVLHAHVTDREDTKKYRDLIQKIFASAKEMDCGEYIQFIPKLGAYYPTKLYEDSSDTMRNIEQFQEDSFWEELIAKLAERDAARRLAPKRLGDLNFEELYNELTIDEEKWAQEFESNGIERLELNDTQAPSEIVLNKIALH